MTLPLRPHISFPFTRTATGVQSVEQGSEEYLMTQAQMVAYTPQGYREDRPEFGWPWPDLKMMPLDSRPLLQALNTFVPDANFTLQQATQIAADTFDMTINVQMLPGTDTTGADQQEDN